MIYYDRKYIMKRILLTWKKKNLDVVGVYEFVVRDKQIIKLYKQPTAKCILELTTQDKKYGGMLEVCLNEYNGAKVGQNFGRCTLLKNNRKDDYYIIAKNPTPEDAIRQVSKESKIYLLILLAITLLAILSMMFMLREFFQI